MTSNHNHIGYQARLDFVQSLLRKEFSVQTDAEITPIQYEPDFPFRCNNFIYHITLHAPITSGQVTKDVACRPRCVAVPDGIKELIVRLANPDAGGMHRETWVENKVVIISLAATALKDFQPHVVPFIYAWGSVAAETPYGWSIQELMPSAPLYEAFPSMDLQQKRKIFAKMAKLLKAFQDFQLPEAITAFGGVAFDENGRVVSAAMPTVRKGLWPP